jgi:hypothetical protein
MENMREVQNPVWALVSTPVQLLISIIQGMSKKRISPQLHDIGLSIGAASNFAISKYVDLAFEIVMNTTESNENCKQKKVSRPQKTGKKSKNVLNLYHWDANQVSCNWVYTSVSHVSYSQR